LFQAKLADCGGEDIINFDKDDVAKVANDLNITIRNIPDIIYTTDRDDRCQRPYLIKAIGLLHLKEGKICVLQDKPLPASNNTRGTNIYRYSKFFT
jgi:hypothetical protein